MRVLVVHLIVTMAHLNDFNSAYCVALLAQRGTGGQSKLIDLAERSSVEGLTINVSKTKPLDVNTNNPSNLILSGNVVDPAFCLKFRSKWHSLVLRETVLSLQNPVSCTTPWMSLQVETFFSTSLQRRMPSSH